ncbi:MAG: threonine synthase [Chitinophagales bacterium]
MKTQIKHLQCLICGETYQPNEVEYVCPKHGYKGILEVVYDYDYIRQQTNPSKWLQNRDTSMWRYKALLPIAADSKTPLLHVGGTPLYDASRLAESLGLSKVWVKDEGRQATASLKDRAAAIAIVKAQELGNEVSTAASTGNAAAALSGLCAGVGQKNVIFVPESAPAAKIAQLLVCGSEVMLVKGTYDAAFELCLQATEKYGWYNRNTGYNPYMTEGKKTVSYEIFEQLGGKAPDVVFVSVGDGCIIGGVYKGFKDLYELGWIEKMPRLMGVQAEGSNYLTEAWQKGEDLQQKPPIAAHTVADSISAGLPRDRFKAMNAVVASKGMFMTVTDEEILRAIPELAAQTGVFAEPAGAAAYAGLLKAVAEKWIDAKDEIVVLNTGNGLKDIIGAQKALDICGKKANLIEPTMEALEGLSDE